MGGNSIFICSRRADSAWGERLERELARRFGAEAAVRDRVAPADGGWRGYVEEALDTCALMIVPIGPSWTEPAGRDAVDRGWRGDELVACEIERGLQRLDVHVVPVLCDEARMPAFSELPPALVGLSDLRPLRVSDERWAYDSDRLRHCVRRFVPERKRWWAAWSADRSRRPANARSGGRSRSASSAAAWSAAR